MPRVTFFKTRGNNLYMYSFNKNYILTSNTIFIRLFLKYYKHEHFRNPNATTAIRKLLDEHTYSFSETKYFIIKFNMLRNVGFFDEMKNISFTDGSISAKDIEYELINSRSVVFEITERCNLNCDYCFYGNNYNQYDERHNHDLDTDNAKAILDFLTLRWKSNLNVSREKEIYIGFYGGEPLLNFTFINSIVKYVNNISKNEKLKFRFNMTTNGVLLDSYMKFMVDNNFMITISLDGNKEENNYRLFKDGRSSFNIVYKNIHLLKEQFPDFFNKNVKFNAVLHDKNNLIQIRDYVKNEFDHVINGSKVNPLLMGEKFKYREHSYDFRNNEDIKCFLSSNETFSYNLFLRNYSNFHFEDYNDAYFRNSRKHFLPTGTCNPFSRRIFITAKGKILPCETIGHNFALGNVANGKVKIDTLDIANNYNKYYNQIRKQCLNCYKINFCTKCLFLNIIKNDDDMNCKSTNYTEHALFLADFYSIFEEVPGLYKKVWEEIRYA